MMDVVFVCLLVGVRCTCSRDHEITGLLIPTHIEASGLRVWGLCRVPGFFRPVCGV